MSVHNNFVHNTTVTSGTEPPHYRGFTITLRHTSLGSIFWTSDGSVAVTSTWQHHTTLTRGIHASGSIRTRISSQRAAADPRLKQRGRCDRLS